MRNFKGLGDLSNAYNSNSTLQGRRFVQWRQAYTQSADRRSWFRHAPIVAPKLPQLSFWSVISERIGNSYDSIVILTKMSIFRLLQRYLMMNLSGLSSIQGHLFVELELSHINAIPLIYYDNGDMKCPPHQFFQHLNGGHFSSSYFQWCTRAW